MFTTRVLVVVTLVMELTTAEAAELQAVEQVQDLWREAIADGELSPDSKLRAVAVSKTPI